MPEKGDKEALEKARKDLAEGKAPTTAAGEFVREEIHHVREGRHGARSPKQAIAIGLSKARRAGVELPPPAPGKTSAEVERKAEQDIAAARKHKRPSGRRSRAIAGAVEAGADRGCPPQRERAEQGGEEGLRDEGPGAAARGGTQGGPDTQGAQLERDLLLLGSRMRSLSCMRYRDRREAGRVLGER